MGIVNRSKNNTESNDINIYKLIMEEYEQRYLEEYKYIWRNYLPKQGQADILQ